MKKKLIFFYLLFLSIIGKSQINIVPNPSFDQTATACPNSLGHWTTCANWDNVNMSPIPNNGICGTPDYYNTCGSGNFTPTNTPFGTCNTHSGNGMFGLCLYNIYKSDWREYISTELTCNMEPGLTYTVSFWLNNGTNLINSGWTIRNIGVQFSNSPLIQNGYSPILINSPTYEIPTNIAHNFWDKYTFTVIPNFSWNRITIGSFKNDIQNNPIPTYTSQSTKAYAYYFIDDIEVLRPSSLINLNATIIQPGCSNPASATITPSNPNFSYSYNWFPGSYTNSIVNNLNSGVYSITATYSINSCNNFSSMITLTINPSPIPTISIASPAPPYCVGDCINLLGNGATNYTWLPNNSNGNNTWVCPTSNTTYTLVGTNSMSCSSTATIQINPSPLPNLSVSVQPSPLCVGSNPTITASGANSYTWLPNNSNGNTLTLFNLNSSTSITLLAKNNLGCSNSTLISINPLPNPSLSIAAIPIQRCSGTPATITCNGANSYTWLPNNFVSNSIIVNPPNSSVYTIIGKALNGCTTALNYTLNAPIPNPILQISANPAVICPGYPSTLTVNGASNYFWSPTNSNSTTIVVTPTNSTTYHVFGTNALGCQGYTNITLNPGNSINLSSSNYTFCTNATTSIPISVNTTLTNHPINFVWQPGNLSGQTINVNPSQNTTYTVNAYSSQACPNTVLVAVNVTSNCCLQSTVGMIPLSSLNSNYINQSYFIPNSITLTANSFLQDAEFLMMPNVKITVPNGLKLDLDHAHLYACGINMWQGIEIEDGGQITSSNIQKGSNLIEDAVIGIDLDNITSNHATPPISIDNTIFNKNYIGIKISNGSTLTSLPLRISECVFTSRDISSTSPGPFLNCSTCWPQTDFNLGGLRTPLSPIAMQGLSSPFPLQMIPPSTSLKIPYQTNVCSQIGIAIQNIGHNAGNTVNQGVDIGITYPNINTNYNLFDNLITGIDVQDASLQTINNVFQNMNSYYLNGNLTGGQGIKQQINGLMNAKLNLSPFTNSNLDGNKFWNCWHAIEANDAFDVKIENNIFRSDRNLFTGNGPGLSAIDLNTNRFDVNINFNEFNNIENAVNINVTNGLYDLNGTLINGTYADRLNVSQNYFGPEVASTIPVLPNSEYCNSAININGSSANNWQFNADGKILSNKIDRTYRGISYESFSTYSMEIGGNTIRISDDINLLPNSIQYGIYAKNSDDNLVINQNEVMGDGTNNPNVWNQNLKCIISDNNQSAAGAQSPIIKCNQVYDAYVGFEFSQPQPNTVWLGNTMHQKMHIGLSLVNNGQIGTQGSPILGCGAFWNNNSNTTPFTWSSPLNYETYVDGLSSAWPGSFLYCGTPGNLPTNNGTSGPGTSFQIGTLGSSFASLDNAKVGYDCVYTNYPALPSQRSNSSTQINQINDISSSFNLFPNPTNGLIKIISPLENENLSIKIIDVSGKVIETFEIKTINYEYSLNLPLEQSFYFIEIQNSKQEIIHKKVVILK